MNFKKIARICLVSLLLAGIAAYLMYATLYMSAPDPTERCEALELTVERSQNVHFVDKQEVEEMLRKANIYPVGQLMTVVNTQQIEETIGKNAFVEKVNCYKSAKGKLCIKLKQRKPVVYVLPDGKDGYFVDATGKIIPNTHYAENIVTASGKIDEMYASTQLAQFGMYLQEDDFWNSQIEQIYVTSTKGHEPQIELVPRVGDHVVSLGTIDDYENKLNRLKIFYQKAMGTVGWNKYSRISIEYGRQIICTKRKD